MTSARSSEILSETLPTGWMQVSRAGCVGSELLAWHAHNTEGRNVDLNEYTWLVKLDCKKFLPIQVQCRVTPSGHNAHIAGGDHIAPC